MKKRALGKTGIEVSEIGFGGWAIGGNEHGNSLGPTEDRSSRAAVEAALAAGITFFDTADIYGHGRSESILGETFAALGKRAGVVVATKAGADFAEGAPVRKRHDPPYLREAVLRSLERLRTDRVDLYQLHDPPIDVIRSPATHDALRALKEAGLARAVGVSLHTVDEGLAAIEAGVYDTIQVVMNVPYQWVANRILGAAQARGIGIMAREPLVQGFLTGKYNADHVFAEGDIRARWSPEHRRFLVEMARRMREYFHVRRRVQKPLSAIAIQFVLAHPAVSTVIASMKTPAQVQENVAVSTLEPLTRRELAWLRE